MCPHPEHSAKHLRTHGGFLSHIWAKQRSFQFWTAASSRIYLDKCTTTKERAAREKKREQKKQQIKSGSKSKKV